MRLKPKEVKAYRLKLLKQQNYQCPLCEQEIKEHEATLDHSHDTGHCRRVLHRSCNQSEGRIKSWVKRSRATDAVGFLRNLVTYLQTDWKDQPIHPNHKSDIEKQIQKIRKRMRKCKTERGKQRNQDLINKLKRRV